MGNNRKIVLLILIFSLTSRSFSSKDAKNDINHLNLSEKLNLDKYLPLPKDIQNIITEYNSVWELKKTLFGGYSFDHISYSPDGRHLAVIEGRDIKIFDTVNYSLVKTLESIYKSIKFITYSQNGKYFNLAFTDLDKVVNEKIMGTNLKVRYEKLNINIYDAIDNYKLLKTLTISKDINTRFISHSSDNKYLACPEKNKVKVFDINNKYKHFVPIDDFKNGKINCIAYSPVSAKAESILSSAEVSGTPDNKYLATAGSSIKIWDTSIDNFEQGSEKDASSSKVLSGVKRFFGNAIRKLLNKVNYKLIAELKGNDNEIISIQYSPNNKYIASMEKLSIKIWDALTYNLLYNLKPEFRKIHGADNKQLSEEEIFNFMCAFNVNPSFNSLAYSKDGKYLAAGSENGNIYIWDGHTYNLMQKITNKYPIICISFSPDSRYLAAIVNSKRSTTLDDENYQLSKIDHLYGRDDTYRTSWSDEELERYKKTEEKEHGPRDYNTIKIWQYEGID